MSIGYIVRLICLFIRTEVQTESSSVSFSDQLMNNNPQCGELASRKHLIGRSYVTSSTSDNTYVPELTSVLRTEVYIYGRNRGVISQTLALNVIYSRSRESAVVESSRFS